MKNWYLLALLLAVLAAGVWLGWSEDDPAMDPESMNGGEDIALDESRDSTLSSGPSKRNRAGRTSASESDTWLRQASVSSPADDGPSRPTVISSGTPSAGGASEFEQAENLVIGGLVMDEDSNPLSDIEVLAKLVDVEGNPHEEFDRLDEGVLSVYSDSNGEFMFSGLADGAYRVRIAPYDDISPAQTTVRVGTLNVSLVAIILWDLRIYGTVSDTSDSPLPDVQITAGRQTRPTHTGSKGEYRLNLGMKGVKQKQFVHFRRDGYRDQKLAIDPEELDYLASERQFDVTMEPHAALTTVAGNLTDTEGRPVPGQILTMASSRLRTSYQAQSDKSGKFAFNEVEPGKDYRLQIRPGSVYQDKDINSLEVPGKGLNLDIVLDLIEQGQLSGWMIDLEANTVPGFTLNLHSRVVAGESVRVEGDQKGFFQVQDFPVGDAVFSTNSYPVFSVQGIRVSPDPEEPIMVILDAGNHVLEGQVIDSAGQPVPAASVLLTWSFNDNGVQSSSSRKTAAEQNGYFVFTGLGPGLHRMQVSASGFKTAVVKIDVGVQPGDVLVTLEELID